MIRLPLWPSAASKWINCSGQPRIAALGNKRPRVEEDYLKRGQLAHGYLESRLKGWPPDIGGMPEEDIDVVCDVVDDIIRYSAIGGLSVLSEEECYLEFDTGRYDMPVHKMRLILDVVMYNEEDLVVVDYKHGEGVPVPTEDNPQLLLYLAAARGAYPGRKRMQVGIIQPRGQGEGWSMCDVTHRELDDFLESLKPAVTAAYADVAEYIPGPHCQFCAGTTDPVCPAMLGAAIDATMYGGEDPAQVQPWWLLDHIEDLKKTIKGVDKASFAWLLSGKRVEGWTLDRRPGRRRWSDPDEVPAVLAEILGGEETDYQQKIKVTPITMTAALKMAKQKGVDIKGLLEQGTTLKRVRELEAIGLEEIK